MVNFCRLGFWCSLSTSSKHTQYKLILIRSDALQKAQERYENKRQVKRVSFNIETEKELLQFANSVDFSRWVKQKITEAIAVPEGKAND